MAVNFSASSAGRYLPPEEIPSSHFCLRLRVSRILNAAGRIKSVETCNDFIRNPSHNNISDKYSGS
jgi:hypothetical protein